MARMLGRARYRVQCCRDDDYGGKPHNRRLVRRLTKRAERQAWRKETHDRG